LPFSSFLWEPAFTLTFSMKPSQPPNPHHLHLELHLTLVNAILYVTYGFTSCLLN
jgi:hypothetical protein